MNARRSKRTPALTHPEPTSPTYLPPEPPVLSNSALSLTSVSNALPSAPLPKSSPTGLVEVQADATAARLAIDLEGREVQAVGLKEYFVDEATTEERTIIDEIAKGVTGLLGEESTMSIVQREMQSHLGDTSRWTCSGGSNAPIKTLYELDKPPDVVILTRDAASDPTFVAEWARPGTGTSDRRHWNQVLAVGEIKESEPMQYEATEQIRRHLLRIAVTPLRQHTFGFTVAKATLTIYLLTSSGFFYSPKIDLHNNTSLFILFLLRLLTLSDYDLGLLGSTLAPPLTPTDPITLPSHLLPPRPSTLPSLTGVDTSSIRLDKLLFRRFTATGRCTSTFKARVGKEEKELAVSILFAERSSIEDHDSIRESIASAAPEQRTGLSLTVEVLRGEFGVGPTFVNLGGTMVPRALEFVFQEKCYKSILGVSSTVGLARVVLGAVKGHRSLFNLGFIHRDISVGNVMVDEEGNGVLIDYNLSVAVNATSNPSERQHRAGTHPFLARALIDTRASLGVTHRIWHDFESLLYVVLNVAFTVLTILFSKKARMSAQAAQYWAEWNSSIDVPPTKNGLKNGAGRRLAVNAAQPGWSGLRELVNIICESCGLGRALSEVETPAEEDVFLVEKNTVSHANLIAQLETFIASASSASASASA